MSTQCDEVHTTQLRSINSQTTFVSHNESPKRILSSDNKEKSKVILSEQRLNEKVFEKVEKDDKKNEISHAEERRENFLLEKIETKNDKIGSHFFVEKETEGKWMYCKVVGCNFWTRKPLRMTRHSNSHAVNEENKLCYECPDCHVRISTLPKLLRHDRKFHTGFKDYECKICEAEVTDIIVHMRVSAI